jgi:hypothetical protein
MTAQLPAYLLIQYFCKLKSKKCCVIPRAELTTTFMSFTILHEQIAETVGPATILKKSPRLRHGGACRMCRAKRSNLAVSVLF